MNANRTATIIAGVLFIAATVAALVGSSLTDSILDAPDYLVQISANQSRITLGALLQFIAAVTSAGIAIALYPVLRRQNEGLALGSVGFRIIEGVFYIVAALGLLSLVSLSQEYVKAGAPAASDFQILGSLILAGRNSAGFGFAVISFCLGSLMYFYVFFQARLVPRWLSVWGMIAIAMLLAMALSVMFGAQPSGTTLVLAVPIAVQEMVLAVWLIAKGVNSPATAESV